MAKTINFQYKDKVYTLEFTRETVKALQRTGFKASDLADYPDLTLPKLFFGAFRANHPTMRMALAEEILDNIKDRTKLIDKLSEMYSEPLETLMDDSAGNVEWTADF